MTADQIPNTAWEQAVFVALFVVFTLGLIGAVFTALFKIVNMFKDITNQFQATITTLGKDWQTYYAEREEQFWRRNSALVDMIGQLIKAFERHDEKFDDTIKEMRAAQERREAAQTAADAVTQKRRGGNNDARP
jgi:hypothetical protein